ncbi:MAG TPA: DISARM system SNF2-like helicase DrmD [Myxococcota bacterium]|nr:DISARM system SNF2-like helicase DrmD [Myxococcota bacterium]HQK52562.1 DISARM system SNF2-like helicase DrmD [Myxococcota bacterium]
MNPRVGMLATIRNRRGIVASVEPYDTTTDGRLHLVRVEYVDGNGPPEDVVLWEREPNASLLEPTALPRVGVEPPMLPADFDALVRACRWSAMTPFGTDGTDPIAAPIASPVFGAVQLEDFQLVPVLMAMRMPRVSLLLADDVGLGKTIEAGLILTELLVRRRVRRVLILCPASLREQWQQEMHDKFALPFDVVDRSETHALQKRLGLDANPWRTFPRIIASYHYLRQPDVLEQFRAACRQPEGSSVLPWDLLIVDEAHNLMPSNFGEDSDLCKMLRLISPWFEHKLFLTATPHNGYTRCFSGLLELLDPVRFTQTSEFKPEERKRVEEVVIRRLKRELNALDRRMGRPERFAARFLQPVPLFFGPRERALSAAFLEFRKGVRAAVASSRRADQLAGTFAIEVLNKRLLSCPATFADSWFRFKEGMDERDAARAEEMSAAHRASEEDLADDREKVGRGRHASRIAGAWLKPLAGRLADEIAAVDAALEALGLGATNDAVATPTEDQRWERLLGLVNTRLRQGQDWLPDERLIVFTEYKTTLDYLYARLRAEFGDDGRAVRVLYGGEDCDREAIRTAFNNPADPVRILVATDAASEGMNLQETARLLLHFDIPWNPARLEQRNGRLDRHGQARDVTVFHFVSDDDADLKFLAHVVTKVHAIREDLGAMGEVFDAAFQARFVDLGDSEDVVRSMDAGIEHRRVEIPRATDLGASEAERISDFCRWIDLTPETLRQTLEVALGMNFGRPRLDGPDGRGRFRLRHPIPPSWQWIIDETLRIERSGRGQGALPGIVFDPRIFVKVLSGRPVFRPARDTVLLHLGHPLFRQALGLFARARFPGGHPGGAASRWTVRLGEVPPVADALVLLTVEELAVNKLREPFHHWVRTIRLPVIGGRLKDALPEMPPADDHPREDPVENAIVRQAADLWNEVEPDLPGLLERMTEEAKRRIEALLAIAERRALAAERERFRHRINEVERAMQETTLQRIERERDRLLADMRQGVLFPEINREREQALRDLEDELRRRRSHYQELLDQLRLEKARVLERLLPARFALWGRVQVFPVAVEIRFPEVRR